MVIGVLLSLVGIMTYMRSRDETVKTTSKASNIYVLQSQNVADSSQFQDTSGALMYDLVPDRPNGTLFKLDAVSTEAVSKFMFDKPTYSLNGQGSSQQLIPDAKGTIRLRAEQSDAQINADLEKKFSSSSFGLQNIDSQKTHYYYEQTRCNGIPVFASYVNVHLTKDAQVYAMSGSLAQGDTSCDKKVSEREAQTIATTQFKKDFPSETTTVQKSLEYVYSPQLLRTAGTTNYLTYFVTVCQPGYCHGYFVDQGDGTIRKQMTMSPDALNRYVFAGSAQRTEGGATSSNQKVNTAYDALGTTWEYFSTKLGRDSFDDRGSMIQASLVNLNNCGWNGQSIECGVRYVALDVLAHEFAHGVTQNTAGLIYEDEPGAMNEGLSDTFAAAIDADDWLMGEESDAGALRSLQNPPQFRNPDSQVSQYYYCGGNQSALVHTNSGVLNKAFYLMSEGGSHNNCQNQGIGRDAAAVILYKTITTHLKYKINSQYLDMYNGINTSCGDIYGASSATCANVKVALEAVMMDKPSRCNGGSTSTTASCVGAQPGTPEPAGTTPTPTTGAPTTGVPTTTPTGTQPQGTPTLTPTPTPGTPSPTGTPILKAEGTLLSTLSAPYTWQGNVKVTLEGGKNVLRSELYAEALQGVNLKSYLPKGVTSQLGVIGTETEVYGRLIGQSGVLETGAFVVTDEGKVLAEYSSAQDLTKYDTYEVFFKGSMSAGLAEIPVLIASLQPPASASQTDKVILDLKLRFQGVSRKPASTQAQLVRIGIGGGDTEMIQYKKIVFTAVDEGVWTGRIFYEIPAGDTYKLLVKGPKHIQKKYCDNNPRESEPGNYLCESEAITLSKGVNTIDLTNVMQLAGDTNQDGRVNARDISTIRTKLGSTRAEDLLTGDLNNDGVVNAVDDSLILYTLSNRPQQS